MKSKKFLHITITIALVIGAINFGFYYAEWQFYGNLNYSFIIAFFIAVGIAMYSAIIVERFKKVDSTEKK